MRLGKSKLYFEGCSAARPASRTIYGESYEVKQLSPKPAAYGDH
jgi:hypothetical protein